MSSNHFIGLFLIGLFALTITLASQPQLTACLIIIDDPEAVDSTSPDQPVTGVTP